MRVPVRELIRPDTDGEAGAGYLTDAARAASYGIVVSRDGVIVDINDSGAALGGYADKSMIVGRGFEAFAAPNYHAVLEGRSQLRAVGATVPDEYQFMGVDANGRQIPMRVKVSRFVLPSGPITLVAFQEAVEATDDDPPA